MFTKTEIYFSAPAYNNYACLLPPSGNVNWSVFKSAFCQPCKFMTGEMVQMAGSKSAVET